MDNKNFIDQYGTFIINDENKNVFLNLYKRDVLKDKISLVFPNIDFDFQNNKTNKVENNENQQSNEFENDINRFKIENEKLKSRLDELTLKYSEILNKNTSESVAVKQVIIELRKKLGQGNHESDFSDEFPYTPILKPKQ